MITLTLTKRTDPRLLALMPIHYSQPKGFVGRNLCYAVEVAGVYYGHTVGGSAPAHLPGRNEFLGVRADRKNLNSVVSNLFFHVEKVNGRYPLRNFTTQVISDWRERVRSDWFHEYGDVVIGFETLVQLPRTGECYLRDGWALVGKTKGFSCKRAGGQGTDSWSGRRVWNTDPSALKPKLVFCRKADGVDLSYLARVLA